MQRQLTEADELFIKESIAKELLNELGFIHPRKTPLFEHLAKTKPSRGTSFYDSVVAGISLILKLNILLSKLDMEKNWNFVHIVLTDGDDTSSKSSLKSAVDLMRSIGLTLNTSTIKTYFIGVDVEKSEKASRDIAALNKAGGENAQFFTISDVKIEDIFERIRLGLEIYQQTSVGVIGSQNVTVIGKQTRNIPVVTAKRQKFVVLFNLDASGSMEGERWKKVCASVKRFGEFLGNDDLVGAIVFNDEVKIIEDPRPKSEKTSDKVSKPAEKNSLCQIF